MTPLQLQSIPKRSLAEFLDFSDKLGVNENDAEHHYRDARDDLVFRNDTYLVIYRDAPREVNPHLIPGIKQISIRRLDGKPVRNWRELQQIKNQLLGESGEAIEVFPAEGSRVDSVNQYHLFGGADWKAPFRFPS